MTDPISSMVTESTNLIPRLPDGFKFILAPGNVIVAVHPEYSTHYLNEKTMQWRVLNVHVSEVAKDART